MVLSAYFVLLPRSVWLVTILSFSGMDHSLSIKKGILLDNTYTAKAAAALLHYLEKEKFNPGSNILFWHTGGVLAEL